MRAWIGAVGWGAGRQGAVAWAAAVVAWGSVGCGAGPSREEIARSRREYDIGVGLFEERNFSGAFEHLSHAIRIDPGNAEAYFMLGSFFMFRRNWAQAEHYLREAIRVNEAEGTRPSLTPDAKNTLGVVLVHAERYEDAVSVLRQSAADLLNRSPYLALGNLAWAHKKRRRFRASLSAASQAVRVRPDFCLGWFRKAEAHVGLEEFEEAAAALSGALDVENATCRANQAAWRLRGEVHARLGHRDEALEALERCVELSEKGADGEACARLLSAAHAD